MSTFAEFIATHALKFQAVYIGKRRTSDEWAHFLWRCTFSVGDKHYDFDYRCGMAHESKRGDGKMIPTPPKAHETLQSLTMDAVGSEESFESWAESYGYELDSRRARSTYRACRRVRSALVRLLGSDGYNRLAECTEE